MGPQKVPLNLEELGLAERSPRRNRPAAIDNLDEAKPRDPRDEASPPTPPTTSRSISPYTQNPTVDFDGLSWPSEWWYSTGLSGD